jgi:hypothetical protein
MTRTWVAFDFQGADRIVYKLDELVLDLSS